MSKTIRNIKLLRIYFGQEYYLFIYLYAIKHKKQLF
jgi:hypothetical protein